MNGQIDTCLSLEAYAASRLMGGCSDTAQVIPLFMSSQSCHLVDASVVACTPFALLFLAGPTSLWRSCTAFLGIRRV